MIEWIEHNNYLTPNIFCRLLLVKVLKNSSDKRTSDQFFHFISILFPIVFRFRNNWKHIRRYESSRNGNVANFGVERWRKGSKNTILFFPHLRWFMTRIWIVSTGHRTMKEDEMDRREQSSHTVLRTLWGSISQRMELTWKGRKERKKNSREVEIVNHNSVPQINESLLLLPTKKKTKFCLFFSLFSVSITIRFNKVSLISDSGHNLIPISSQFHSRMQFVQISDEYCSESFFFMILSHLNPEEQIPQIFHPLIMLSFHFNLSYIYMCSITIISITLFLIFFYFGNWKIKTDWISCPKETEDELHKKVGSERKRGSE